jgi:lipopolysaccharide transport system ATP-binding protein
MALVTATNLMVEFPIYGARSRSLKHTFIRAATGGTLARDSADRVVVRALDDVSFVLREGDRVGLVGHNGSGKSTLLRVLAGAYEPVGGGLTITGRVAAMLSIGLGMEMEATGYENIYMQAAILGFRRREIDGLVADIAEFTELGDYLEMPMRTYSSGMVMRLAFAVSTCVSADILLMDEWLSVGDSEFSERAQGRLRALVGKARVLVLASHDANLVRANCNRVLRLEHGRLISDEMIS